MLLLLDGSSFPVGSAFVDPLVWMCVRWALHSRPGGDDDGRVLGNVLAAAWFAARTLLRQQFHTCNRDAFYACLRLVWHVQVWHAQHKVSKRQVVLTVGNAGDEVEDTLYNYAVLQKQFTVLLWANCHALHATGAPPRGLPMIQAAAMNSKAEVAWHYFQPLAAQDRRTVGSQLTVTAVVTSYVPHVTLATHLASMRGPNRVPQMLPGGLELAYSIATALEDLHSGDMVHNSVDLEHFAVHGEVQSRVWLLDVTSVCDVESPVPPRQGTDAFRAPELFAAEAKRQVVKASQAADVWAVCVVFVYIIASATAIGTEALKLSTGKYKQLRATGDLVERQLAILPDCELKDIIRFGAVQNPTARPTMRELRLRLEQALEKQAVAGVAAAVPGVSAALGAASRPGKRAAPVTTAEAPRTQRPRTD